MSDRCLPWPTGHSPLMLAPMQGLTNRALRGVFGRTVRPDVLFTEFVRVRPGSKQRVSSADIEEACAAVPGIPLVVQLIGSVDAEVVEAARALVDRGVQHINLNMGCPFGRMASLLSGGGMFRRPESVGPMLADLRKVVGGSLSVKTRAGFDDPRQIFDLLPAFENAGIDFLIMHPRTVTQKYGGQADHNVTKGLVTATPIPIIANGDINDAATAKQVLEDTGAAGLMLGRGAVSDPVLFERIRGKAPMRPTGLARQKEIAAHLQLLLDSYTPLFCGDKQVLIKLKEAMGHTNDADLSKWLKKLRRAKTIGAFSDLLR